MWAIDGFDGFIKTMRVVNVSIKLDLAGFPGPPVIFHRSEGPLDFGSDGRELSLQCCGLWIGKVSGMGFVFVVEPVLMFASGVP